MCIRDRASPWGAGQRMRGLEVEGVRHALALDGGDPRRLRARSAEVLQACRQCAEEASLDR
eukprot:9488442-Alexandrium_andersonii.AAC.1